MPLAALQQRLQSLYDIELDHRVEDYVVTDARFVRVIEGDTPHQPREKLLICQQGEELLLSLYLDAGLLADFERSDPLVSGLENVELADLCIVLEGISHFVYTAWNAGHERNVSLLELELQAEVDKFLLLSVLLREQLGEHPDDLHSRLFENVRFADELDAAEQQRYQDANNLAAKYCWDLQRRYHAGDRHRWLNELRRFYRLQHGAKLRYINTLH